VALLADTYGAIGVFDAVGGWHGAGGSEFARLLERHVQRSLASIDLVKQGTLASQVPHCSLLEPALQCLIIFVCRDNDVHNKV
jgi:hypothetical protein